MSRATRYEENAVTDEERAFWDMAYCAALTGAISTGRDWVKRGQTIMESHLEMAMSYADASLTARRQRSRADG